MPQTPSAEQADLDDQALDAVTAAPESHNVLFENEYVRTLEVVLTAGQSEPVHVHRWPCVMVSLSDCDVVYNSFCKVDGAWVTRSPEETRRSVDGRTKWMEPEGPHAVANRSSNLFRAIRIELKT